MSANDPRIKRVEEYVCELVGASKVVNTTCIQSLWSGYGEILRCNLAGSLRSSVIVKWIKTSKSENHPRGWNTHTGHARKLKSYEIECNWYQYHAVEDKHCRVPEFIGLFSDSDHRILVLEDLDAANYALRAKTVDERGLKSCIRWLAAFHARYIGTVTENLWPIGTYWHLATRREEYEKMPRGPLFNSAQRLDRQLNSARHQTIVHGDAKIANFCFAPSFTQVAALDFQYVGSGIGVKDLAYFLGSCLNSDALFELETKVINFYFDELRVYLSSRLGKTELSQLETEWRSLYSLAVADFVRFLQGWQPGHHKLNAYTQFHVENALALIS